jgi:hypothetical protein
MVQGFSRNAGHGTEALCEGSGSSAMSHLPWQGTVHHLCHLSDKNGFDPRSQGTWDWKRIDLSEHSSDVLKCRVCAGR